MWMSRGGDYRHGGAVIVRGGRMRLLRIGAVGGGYMRDRSMDICDVGS